MISPDNSGVVCEACGGKNPVRVTHKRGCQIWFCGDCALFFVWPPPSLDILQSIYTKAAGYYTTATEDLSLTSPEPAKRLHNLLMSLGQDSALISRLSKGAIDKALELSWDNKARQVVRIYHQVLSDVRIRSANRQ
jgi:hypothetical protein